MRNLEQRRTRAQFYDILGLEKDLDLHGFQYNIALTVFYVAYIVVEIPSNLALKHFGSVWIGLLVISFGVVSIGTAFIHNFGHLVATRIFLGLAEGGTLVSRSDYRLLFTGRVDSRGWHTSCQG